MSQAFFDELAIPAPEYHHGSGSGSHARPNFMKVAPLIHALSARNESARKAGIDLRI
jgi:hypothetical protein